MIRLSPVGLAAAPVANQLSMLATFREKLCCPFCIDSSVQPLATLEYTAGTPTLNGATVFVPITARLSITTGGGCKAKTQLFTEQFYAAFQGQTVVPTAVAITSVGRVQGGAHVHCGRAYEYSVNDSIIITITPPTASATPAT